MSITKLKAFVLKTRIPYGDILKGVMEVKKLSKIFNFSIPPLTLYKYLIDDKIFYLLMMSILCIWI